MNDNLPPLPCPAGKDYGEHGVRWFTDEQVRQIQHEAYAAGLAAAQAEQAAKLEERYWLGVQDGRKAQRVPMTEQQAEALLLKHGVIWASNESNGQQISVKAAIAAIMEASRGLTKEQVLALMPEKMSAWKTSRWDYHDGLAEGEVAGHNECVDMMLAAIEAAYKGNGDA